MVPPPPKKFTCKACGKSLVIHYSSDCISRPPTKCTHCGKQGIVRSAATPWDILWSKLLGRSMWD